MDERIERKLKPWMDATEVDDIVNRHYAENERKQPSSKFQPMRYDQSNDVYTGVTADGIGVSVKGQCYREAQEVYIKAEDGAMTAELEDPDSWIGDEDGENVWTW